MGKLTLYKPPTEFKVRFGRLKYVSFGIQMVRYTQTAFYTNRKMDGLNGDGKKRRNCKLIDICKDW